MADDKSYLMVYVFNGSKASFPSGVFADRDSAIAWISDNTIVLETVNHAHDYPNNGTALFLD
jgi:hypothetical protein